MWGGTYQNYLNPIIVQQKRFIRLLVNADRDAHTTPIFHRLKLLKFHDVYKYFISIHVFKARKKGLYTTDHSRPSRYRNLVLPSLHRLTLTQHSVSYAGPKIWNHLPENVRSIDSLPRFKSFLKRYFLNKYSS